MREGVKGQRSKVKGQWVQAFYGFTYTSSYRTQKCSMASRILLWSRSVSFMLLGNRELQWVTSFKYLGINFLSNLAFKIDTCHIKRAFLQSMQYYTSDFPGHMMWCLRLVNEWRQGGKYCTSANRLLSSTKPGHVKSCDRLAAKRLMMIIKVKGEHVELCLH